MRRATVSVFERMAGVIARASVAGLWLCVLLLCGVPLHGVTIDDFSVDDAALNLEDPTDSAGDTTQSFVNGGSILGNERLLTLRLISAAANSGTTAEVTGGQLVFSADASTRGQIAASWDGQTGDPLSELDTAVGLGGVDLTAANHSGLRLTVASTSAVGVEVELDVFSSATNASRFVLKLPMVAASTGFICSFSDFMAMGAGGAADFTAVTAIVLKVRGTDVSANIDALETVGPELLQANVINVDDLDDTDMDGFADPGETVKFSITLTNTGAEAQSIDLGDALDANVTGQVMSLFTTPIAQRDTYQTCGNVSLTVPAGSGVLANDSDPDGDSTLPNVADPILTVTATDTSLTAGSVSINADGSFTYTPPAFFQGVDSFGYTVTDDDGRTSTGQVAIALEGVLWFVDDDDGTGPFDGTQANPFNALSQVEAASNPGDIIYVLSDDGTIDRLTETLTLKDDQQLIGGGVALQVCGLNIPAGTTPGINDSGAPGTFAEPVDKGTARNARRSGGPDKGVVVPPTLTVANRNQVRGILLEAGEDTVLGADTITDLTVTDTTIRRLFFAGGIVISDVSGTVTFNNLTVADSGASSVFDVMGGDADIDVVGSTIAPTAGALVYLDGHAGSMDFTGGSLSLTGGTSFPAIELMDNTGTYNFASLTSIATSQEGILADSGGTFSVPAATTIQAGQAALDLTNGTQFGSSPQVIAGLTSTGGSRGVRISAVPQALTVSGLVSINGSDRGIEVADSGTVTMSTAGNSVVSDNGPALDVSATQVAMNFATLSSSSSPAEGIDLDNVTGSISAAGGAITNGAAASSVDINGGSGTFTYGGTITENGSGRSAHVQSHGGTVTFSGAIDDNGSGPRLAGNTGTIHFTGGMDIDSGNSTGFTATGGGTVNVTGTNTVDVNGAPSAIVLNGISIGAEDMTFASINGTATTGPGISISSTTNAGSFFGGATVINGTGALQPGIAITGSSATFGFTSATVDTTGGAGIALSGNNGPVTFTTVDIDGTSGPGLDIDGNTNAVVVDAGSIGATTTSGADGVDINGGNGAVTIDATIRQTTANNSVQVVSRTGGTVVFNGAVDDTAGGILLSPLGAGTVTFRGGMTLNTGANTAFRATGGGTINVCASTLCGGGGAPVNNDIGNITALSMEAVTIIGMTLGADGMTFRRISVNGAGSGATAIALSGTTGTGSFRVTGDGSTTAGGNGSGGTIENINETDAIVLNNTAGLVSLANMIIEDIAGNSDASEAIGTRSMHDGIQGQLVLGGLRLQSVTMRRFSDHAILGAQFGDGVNFTTWNGLEIRDSVFQNSNRFHVADRGDDGDEGMIRIRGLTGTMVMTGSTVSLGARGLDLYTPSGAGTLDVTIQNNTFTDIYKEFSSGATLNVGGRGFSAEARGSHDMVVRIGDPAELNPALGNTFTNNLTASVVVLGQEGGTAAHTGDIDTVVSRNSFIVTDHSTPQFPPGNFQFNFPQGGLALVAGGGTFDAVASFNSFDEVMHAAGGLGQLTLAFNGGAGQAHIHDNTFELPWDSALQISADGNTSGAVLVENNTFIDGVVGGASDDLGGPSPSPFNPVLVNVRGGGSLDLTMRNETLPQHDIVFTPGDRRQSLVVEVQADNGSNALDLHLLNNRGPEGYALRQFNGTFRLFRGASASNVAATIVGDNGNTGGGSNDNTVPPAVPTMGTITATGTAPTLPVIVIP